ncbi:MAG: alpha/beta hydrolase [Blastomonas sp.]
MTYQKVTIDRRAIPDGAVESQWHAPDGWPIRRIDLKAGDDARGSLLFMPGRGDIYEKYLETLVHFHAQGWNVTSSDWRGQGGSGRLTPNQYVGHIDDFSTWIGDIAFFWERWKAENPGPHVVIGHSMGGHLLVRALIDKVIDPVAAVLSAPMLGLHNYGLPLSFGQKIARLMMKLGDPLRPAWKVSEKPASPLRIRQKLLTHDSDRYEDELQWWAQRPELVMGPGSWTWVERAFASAQYNSAPGRYEGIDCPVLLIGTTADQLVRYGAIAEAAERIPGAELKTYGKECAHEILREADPVRDEVLRLIDDFLERKAHR